jgi:hypothetical protein
MPPKGRDSAQSHKSDQDLAKIEEYFRSLPRSLPTTILSDVKWFPYSHYEFQRDGSPHAEFVERSRMPAVPEMLSIVLPTGFDASHMNGGSITGAPPPPPPLASSNRAAPTIVDFPSTPREGKEDFVQRKQR